MNSSIQKSRAPAHPISPPVDIIETADTFTFFIDLPGSSADQIDVRLLENSLTIDAPSLRHQKAQGSSVVQEYGAGSFYRKFFFDGSISQQEPRAQYADGVLTITLAKGNQKQIPIRTNENQP